MYRDQSGNRKTSTKVNNHGFSLVELIVAIAIIEKLGEKANSQMKTVDVWNQCGGN